MTDKKTTDYSKLSAELDEIIESMQTADIDIEAAVAKYERGMAIVKELETYLKMAENKVSRVKSNWDKG